LWHAPSAKAQECCPDQYSAAELAKAEGSARKPPKSAANLDKQNFGQQTSEKQSKAALIAKNEPGVAIGTKASGKGMLKSSAIVTVKQPVKSNEQKQ
jgi:hypothetical protein